MSWEPYEYPSTRTFENRYICHSVASVNRPQLENGDKIIMPVSALHRLASMEIDYPMLFELVKDDRVSHCGVLEFVADEGMVYLPEWMMKNLGLEDGELLMVRNVALPKGSFIKLQPHSVDFLEISDPKVVLETRLRSFTCLTTGDTIMIGYNGKEYYIDVVETRPAGAVSVVETDCEVDFARPLDYKEPETKPVVKAEPVQEESVLQFRPFSGTGRRLDGKITVGDRPGSSAGALENNDLGVKSRDVKAGSESNSGHGARGKLMFGSRKTSENGEPAKGSKRKPEPEKEEEPKFKPFSGKSYTLK